MIENALAMLKRASESTKDMQARNTFFDIYRLMLLASASQAAKWAACMEQTIQYILCGHYSGTWDEARELLNRKRKALSQ